MDAKRDNSQRTELTDCDLRRVGEDVGRGRLDVDGLCVGCVPAVDPFPIEPIAAMTATMTRPAAASPRKSPRSCRSRSLAVRRVFTIHPFEATPTVTDEIESEVLHALP